jgi:hypothetical protein
MSSCSSGKLLKRFLEWNQISQRIHRRNVMFVSVKVYFVVIDVKLNQGSAAPAEASQCSC